MRIGILQCDRVRSTLSADYGEYPQMIIEAFNTAAASEQSFTFNTYAAYEGVLPDSIKDCDAYLLTGSRFSVFDHGKPWINPLRDFVVRLNKARIKTIGICFGHQLMAEAMGGKVERADCGWQIGQHKATVITHKDYMRPKTEYLNLAMMCEDQINELPEKAEIIATMPHCQYAFLQYGEHFISTQAHPEFSQAFAKMLINVRKEEFPSKRLARGLTSFNQSEHDGLLLFQWFTHFLTADLANKTDSVSSTDE
ncbi:MAG: GMP synthase [Gammaproteobacteria bacterium]|nr:MAG: GMP synthase [Gammaproteobacteria bacterium]